MEITGIEAAIEALASLSKSSSAVKCIHTGSIGKVMRDLGTSPNSRGEMVHRLLVKVVDKHAYHKTGDFVIWRDPDECG